MYLATIIILLFTVQPILGDVETYEIKKLNNTGIIFEEIGKLLVYHEKWTVFTQISMTDIKEEIEMAKMLEQKIDDVCEKTENKSYPCSTQKLVFQNLLSNINRRSEALLELTNSHRHKRSLFDGIGDGLHYLFGVTNHKNEEKIFSKIANLEEDNTKILHLQKQQISVVKSTYEKIQKPIEKLKLKQKELTETIATLGLGIFSNQRINEIINTITTLILEIEIKQQNLIDILLAVKNNHLHPLLVSPSQLMEIYHKNTPVELRTAYDTDIMLQALDIKSKILNGTLVIKITLPLFNHAHFTIKQIHLTPINTPSNYSLILSTEYNYIAENKKTQEFLMMKKEDFQHYTKRSPTPNTTIYFGPIVTPILKGDNIAICPLNLLFNPYNEENICDFRIKQKPTKLLSKLNKKNTWLYVGPNNTKINIKCEDNTFSTVLADKCILTLKKPCQFKIENQIIFYEGADTKEFKIEQPENKLPLKYKLTENMQKTIQEIFKKQQPPSILKVNGTNEILKQDTLSFDELEKEISSYEDIRAARKQQHIPLASFSFSTIAILIVITLVIVKLKRKCKTKTITPNTQTTTHIINTTNRNTEPIYTKVLPKSEKTESTGNISNSQPLAIRTINTIN